MTDELNPFDRVLSEASRTYNRPPEEGEMPLDDMWKSIEAQAFSAAGRAPRYAQWGRIAAALVVGVGIGRLSFSFGRHEPTIASTTVVRPAVIRPIAAADTGPVSIDPATSRYLGQAAALLIALPAEASGGRPDQPFIKRANDLLLTTRLLIDSQSGSDPAMRNLLEDLELVLVQVVRLEKEHQPSRRTELELIQQALDQRDVIPRLRSAANEYATDD
ncbi:MAG: hypothetical protein ACJ796_12525 [Gemmatimonadaceae bacterium]